MSLNKSVIHNKRAGSGWLICSFKTGNGANVLAIVTAPQSAIYSERQSQYILLQQTCFFKAKKTKKTLILFSPVTTIYQHKSMTEDFHK